MTTLSRKTLIGAGSIVLLLAGAGVIHAATTPGTNNRLNALVNAIAQKFNLNPSDVQQVVSDAMAQQKAQMQANMLQNFKNRLSQAVSGGQLTQVQADQILAKQQEVQTFLSGLPSQSAADRQTAMQSEMTALTQWATQNNIPKQFIPMLGFRGRGRGGFGPLGQRAVAVGIVASINGNTITLTGKNGTSYAVDTTNATITKFAPGSNGAAGTKSTISVGQINSGDTLSVQGTVLGTNVAATQIMDGRFMHPGFGWGKMPPPATTPAQ